MKASGINVHHTDSARDTTTLEAVRSWHLAMGWRDVGYHFLIEGDGRIRVGRPLGTIGAHTLGHNYEPLRRTYTIGVALTGNFEREQPSARQISSLVSLCAWLCHTQGIPYHQVKGHSDFNATACPGKHLSSQLRRIRNLIYAALVLPPATPRLYK